ncbi:hypothetical protein RRG08_015504 [Elysia crispata]|uniref:Peptidase C83 domain-containing protein n=1 Tax=Elysia crispata TaxID=231223 RepID=A0AAE1AD47_9GAST|nr:hypothetical protein RRG08_015504 [Elysia crispata]
MCPKKLKKKSYSALALLYLYTFTESRKSLYTMITSQIKKTKQQTAAVSMKQFYRRPLPQSCIDFTSSEGKLIFSEALASGHMQCFFKDHPLPYCLDKHAFGDILLSLGADCTFLGTDPENQYGLKFWIMIGRFPFEVSNPLR